MTRRTVVLVIMIGFMLLNALPVLAKDGEDDAVVSTWRRQRTEEIKALVVEWLQGKDTAKLYKRIAEISRLESLLAAVDPRMDDFYLLGLKHTSLEGIPAQLLALFLQRNGTELDCEAFFAGRAFEVYQVEWIGSPAAAVQERKPERQRKEREK